MLHVFAYFNHAPQPIEIKCPPHGQELAVGLDGARRVVLWWDVEELDHHDPDGAAVLKQFAPGMDGLWVGRSLAEGQQMQPIFDGVVAECSFDRTTVSVSAMESTPPCGGARQRAVPGYDEGDVGGRVALFPTRTQQPPRMALGQRGG